jgi:hypothetical protein
VRLLRTDECHDVVELVRIRRRRHSAERTGPKRGPFPSPSIARSAARPRS